MKKNKINTGDADSQKDEMLFGIPKKTLIVAVVAITVLLIAAAFVTSLLTRVGKEESAAKYPASTLSHEASQEHRFIASEVLGNTLGCPTLPYKICVPDNITQSEDSYVTATYNDIRVTILESSNGFMDMIYGVLGEVCSESFEIPTIDWTDEISDVGYINGYSAEYHAGKYHLVGRMDSTDYYAVIYRINFDGMDNAVYIQAVTSNLASLQGGKDLLDSMVYTISSEESVESTESTETVPEDTTATESVSEEGQELEFMESTEASATDIYTKDFEVYVSEDMPEVFITFMWDNVTVQPSVLTVTAPDGSVYESDEEYSSDGLEVFYISDAVKGTYIIHGEVAGTIYGCTYEALSKEAFYQIFLNQDLDGEPSTYFDENADFEDEDYEDEDYEE